MTFGEVRGDHREVERALLDGGWTPCGAGDWAIALRSPDGSAAARISPFDPTGPYTALLYREAARTGQVPVLFDHRRLVGGGDLQVMEFLQPAPAEEAAVFAWAPELAAIVGRVHERARRELPWCGPLDTNPSNIMRAADGRVVIIDPFYADGPALCATAAADPDLVAARIPSSERRFLADIPLTSSGPWKPGEQEALRAGLAAADSRAAARESAGSARAAVRGPAADVRAVVREPAPDVHERGSAARPGVYRSGAGPGGGPGSGPGGRGLSAGTDGLGEGRGGVRESGTAVDAGGTGRDAGGLRISVDARAPNGEAGARGVGSGGREGRIL
ncbi:hypothetical protein AB0J83_42315 [Actinoplanes sp. NPDC049596]|uniref:hypothetical protein n=1 Tax=unclassified Actinoplanes TaxID=2626549 RepID=UPI003415C084